MGPRYDESESQPEATATREPLVDLGVQPPPPDASPLGSRPRRKRLSDLESPDDEAAPQPQPKPSGRPTLSAGPTDVSEPPSEPQPAAAPRRPRLVDVPAGEGQELRPRAGRRRLALTLSCDETPGLQNIVDTPPPAGNLPTPKHATVEAWIADWRTQQRFSLALTAGLAAAAIGATIWAVVATTLSYQIAWMALGVGLLVGGTVRLLGRSGDKSFGYLGAALTLFGCLLGNFLSVCLVLASQKGLAPLPVLLHVCKNPVMIPAAIIATFRSLDLLFYGVALYAGYRLSFRRVPEPR